MEREWMAAYVPYGIPTAWLYIGDYYVSFYGYDEPEGEE